MKTLGKDEARETIGVVRPLSLMDEGIEVPEWLCEFIKL